MEKFNQKKYIDKYKKEHYKQFKVNLKFEEYDKLDKYLKDNNISKSDFLKKCIKKELHEK